MSTKVHYEWDIEELEDGDIINHWHGDTVKQVLSYGITGDLVLVRDVWEGDGDLIDRQWAYVNDDKLPEYFTDSAGHPTGVKVPQKYHRELARH